MSNVKVFMAESGASIKGADYNLAYTPDNTPSYTAPWTSQANERSNVNPRFVDHASDNFTLGAAAAGGPLTTVTGSGTGTTFSVATGGGGFFRGRNASLSQYGGNLAAGDVITVGNNTVTIASVSGDAITVTSSFTWELAIQCTRGHHDTRRGRLSVQGRRLRFECFVCSFGRNCHSDAVRCNPCAFCDLF